MSSLEFLDPAYLIKTFSYVGMGAIMFAETGLLAGFILPGDSLLITAGVFAARGDLNPWWTSAICFTGAFLGNTAGYLIGRALGPAVFAHPNARFLKPSHVTQAHAYFDRYGPRTLVIARFVPVVRTLVPTIAGTAGMNFRMFQLYNLIGALLWAGLLPLLGYSVGRMIAPEVLDRYILLVIAGVIALSFLPVAFEVLRHRRAARAT